MDLASICAALVDKQRQRVFAIKSQSRMDRSIESFVRINFTDWRPDAPEEEREAENARALSLVAAARKGTSPGKDVAKMVALSDAARKPIDAVRKATERDMEKLAKQLPVWEWVEGVRGFGPKGLAIVVAETTTASAPLSLSSYTKGLDGIYSRLGFAPYGRQDDIIHRALSTWKRSTWRGGDPALTADEWKAHPFSGARYAEFFVLADSLMRAQRPKDKPHGPYGEVYNARRRRTAETHTEWTPMHAHRDAQRVAFKALLADLYREWMRLTPVAAEGARVFTPSSANEKTPLPVAA